jgi:hypothetical protein
MRIVIKAPRVRGLLALALAGCLWSCATFHPIETTPEAILESIAPADTVRITTRNGEEVVLRVRSVTRSHVTGRVRDMPAELLQIRLDQMQTIELERPDLRKAMLTTFVPAVIAAVIICNQQDCETRTTFTATLGP